MGKSGEIRILGSGEKVGKSGEIPHSPGFSCISPPPLQICRVGKEWGKSGGKVGEKWGKPMGKSPLRNWGNEWGNCQGMTQNARIVPTEEAIHASVAELRIATSVGAKGLESTAVWRNGAESRA